MKKAQEALAEIHNPPLTKSRICDIHGEYTSTCFIGKIWTRCPSCEKELNNSERNAQAKLEKFARDKKWEVSLGSAAIPLRFQNKSLKTFLVRNSGQQLALNKSIDFANEFSGSHSGRCLVFIGNMGTGKTHLSIGIALRIMHQFGKTALFTSVSKLARRIREAKSFSTKETETEAINAFVYPDLLIIDEFGIQSGSDSESRSLFDVLNERYENRKPTIFISNLDVEGFKSSIGARLFDRIHEDGGQFVMFNWSSQRGV